MESRNSDKHQLLTQTCTNQTTSWLVHSLNTFGAKTNHGQIRTHKTHHGPDLAKVSTFPLIIYYVPLHEAHIQMTFCPKSPKIPKVETLATLKAHNFVYISLIKMMFKAKL
jgi:hypothetical protein